MTNAMTRHSDAEQLAAFVDGQLDHEQLQEVTAHLATCEECRGVIGETVAFEREEQAARRAPRRGWWAVAAAVVVAVLAVPFARNYWHLREIRTDQQAVYAAQTDGRVLAGRYTGEPYHGKHSVNRGGNNNTDQADTDKDLAIEVAAGQLIGDAKNDSSPAVLRARALAEAINKEPAIALQTISAIPERARDAATWNDIAVITLANNKYPDALAAADRALQMQPRMPEALFTRWATLYDMHGPAARDVADAARQYLAVDPNSAWANEIREKMRPIQ